MVSKEDLEKVYSQLRDKSLNLEELHTAYDKMLSEDSERVNQLDKQLSAFTVKSAHNHRIYYGILIILGGIILCASAILISIFSKLSNIQNVLILLLSSSLLFIGLLLDIYRDKKYQALYKDFIMNEPENYHIFSVVNEWL